MEAGLDHYWLSGEPGWWARSAEGISHAQFDNEVEPSKTWSGWRRQRMQPMGARFVLAPAWSLALLIVTAFPLLFPGNTPDDQSVASLFFLSSFALLLIQPVRIASATPDGDGMKMVTWLLFSGKGGLFTVILAVIGTITFVGHIVIDVRIGWISYALFLTLWYHLTARAGTALIPQSGRWLVPLSGKWDGSAVREDWVVESTRFRNGVLATRKLSEGRRLEVSGVSRGGIRFIAFQLRHASSLLYDPFVDSSNVSKMGVGRLGLCSARLEGIEVHLDRPPVAVEAAEWDERFAAPAEEE